MEEGQKEHVIIYSRGSAEAEWTKIADDQAGANQADVITEEEATATAAVETVQAFQNENTIDSILATEVTNEAANVIDTNSMESTVRADDAAADSVSANGDDKEIIDEQSLVKQVNNETKITELADAESLKCDTKQTDVGEDDPVNSANQGEVPLTNEDVEKKSTDNFPSDMGQNDTSETNKDPVVQETETKQEELARESSEPENVQPDPSEPAETEKTLEADIEGKKLKVYSDK